jgi:hypothetical protein
MTGQSVRIILGALPRTPVRLRPASLAAWVSAAVPGARRGTVSGSAVTVVPADPGSCRSYDPRRCG